MENLDGNFEKNGYVIVPGKKSLLDKIGYNLSSVKSSASKLEIAIKYFNL
jgi:hypothetical protein